VGYAGGTTANPTYRNIGDHSETIQIDYDPAVISYEDLLDVFFGSHSCTVQSYSRQYSSVILYHDEEQYNLAAVGKAHQEQILGRTVVTEINPFDRFYLAEDYHQKYYMQQVSQIFRDFTAIYPDVTGWVNSTAAARVNGYIGGYGTLEQLQTQIDSLGLLPTASNRLLERVNS
jgi:methionine-S-sulfoxide reductase